MVIEEKNKSSYRSKAHKKLSPQWTFLEGLWAGAWEVEEKGAFYLKKMPREHDDKFTFRLTDAVYLGNFRSTIEGICGHVFKKDPTPQDVQNSVAELFTDIDGCGNSLAMFNQTGFEYFLRDGNAAIFVDAPPLNAQTQEKINNGDTPTLTDRLDDRPNWVLIHANQILNYSFTKIGSKEVLNHVTIEENTLEPDGEFGEKEVKRHRILRRGSFEVLIEVTNERGEKEFVIDNSIPQGSTGLDYVTLFPADDFTSEPPFMRLAKLDVNSYNKESRFDDSIYITTVPRWVTQYDSKEDAKAASDLQTASSSKGLKLWGQFAKAYYAETSGNGLDIAMQRCATISERIEKFGFGLFMPTEVAPKTATEVQDTAGQRESKIASLTRKWQNAVERALYCTAEYLSKMRSKVSVNLSDAEKQKMKMVIDYDRLTFSIDQLRAFDLLVDKGRMSNKTFLEKLSILTEIDAVEEMKRLKEEQPDREAEQKKKAELMQGSFN